MTAQPIRWVATPEGGIAATVGCPDDGRLYGEITPTSDTAGERVVEWRRGEHIFGRALTHPEIGSRLRGGRKWPIEDQATYWIEFVSDVDLAAYLRGERSDADGHSLVRYVPIDHAWLAPLDGVPSQRTGR